MHLCVSVSVCAHAHVCEVHEHICNCVCGGQRSTLHVLFTFILFYFILFSFIFEKRSLTGLELKDLAMLATNLFA